MEKLLRDKRAIVLFVLPGLLFFVVIILAPLVQTGYYSLLSWDGITAPSFIGLNNYAKLFTDSATKFGAAIGHSLILAGMSVFLQLPIALVLALVLASGVRGEKFYRTVYFIPVIVSTVIIGQLWMKIYHPSYGMLNTLLRSTGLENLAQPWLAQKETALASTFIPMIWQYIGYHMLLLYTAAKSVSSDIYEAARVDGATDRQVAAYITLPQIVPMLKTCVIFAIIGSLKSFDLIYILTKGGPSQATEVPATLMYSNIFTKYAYGYGSAMAVFIIVECLLLTVLIQRLFPSDPN